MKCPGAGGLGQVRDQDRLRLGSQLAKRILIDRCSPLINSIGTNNDPLRHVAYHVVIASTGHDIPSEGASTLDPDRSLLYTQMQNQHPSTSQGALLRTHWRAAAVKSPRSTPSSATASLAYSSTILGSSSVRPLSNGTPDRDRQGQERVCVEPAARDGEFVQIDLDDPASAADNEATVRAFWERAAGPLVLDPRDREDARFLDEAVARACGNVQHAVQLRKQLAALGSEQRRAAGRRIDDIPRGLQALVAQPWERIAVEPLVADGLRILCAAREALPRPSLWWLAIRSTPTITAPPRSSS